MVIMFYTFWSKHDRFHPWYRVNFTLLVCMLQSSERKAHPSAVVPESQATFALVYAFFWSFGTFANQTDSMNV